MAYLYFKGVKNPIRIEGRTGLPDLMRRHFSGWPFILSDDEPAGDPFLTIRETKRAFAVTYAGKSGSLTQKTAARVFCDLGVDLVEAYLADTPSLYSLHCAAVSLGGRLVVFPGINRVGKSLLAACLTASGGGVFADDLLGLTNTGTGVSFGLPLRLRLPPPSSLDTLEQYCNTVPTLADGKYRYIYSGRDRSAAFGEEQPLGGIIILDRKKRGKPSLARAASLLGLLHTVYRMRIPGGHAQSVFDRAKLLCGMCPTFVLRYSCAQEASKYLMDLFTGDTARISDLPECPMESNSLPTPENVVRTSGHPPESHCIDRAAKYLRREGVTVNNEKGAAFLIPPEQDGIFYCSPVAAIVWDLLAEPLSVVETIDFLAPAFPSIHKSGLERDIGDLFSNLGQNRLVMPVQGPCGTTSVTP